MSRAGLAASFQKIPLQSLNASVGCARGRRDVIEEHALAGNRRSDRELQAVRVAGAMNHREIAGVRRPVREEDVLEDLARRAPGQRGHGERAVEQEGIAQDRLLEGHVPDPRAEGVWRRQEERHLARGRDRENLRRRQSQRARLRALEPHREELRGSTLRLRGEDDRLAVVREARRADPGAAERELPEARGGRLGALEPSAEEQHAGQGGEAGDGQAERAPSVVGGAARSPVTSPEPLVSASRSRTVARSRARSLVAA